MNNRFRSQPQRGFGRRFSNNPKDTAKIVDAIRSFQSSGKINDTEDSDCFVAKNRFEDFEISEQIKKNILVKKYLSPTPIQDQSIPVILSGKDIIGIANTGTGKTAAFLIPLIDKVVKNKVEKVLIIAPTRELALQIDSELRQLSYGLGIRSALCIGGVSINRQRNDLRQSPNFVIGTPGRIKDLINKKSLHMFQFNNVVLDEADRMVDIGFIQEIKNFILLLPRVRQSMFFSATVSGKVKEILQTFVSNNAVTVSVKLQEVTDNIDQSIVKVQNKGRKLDQLHELLIKEGFDKVLIFGRTKWGIQKLSDELVKRGFKAGAIHGNKRQNQRQKTLDQFKRSEIRILLATDVASRGLDIENVTHVINYDMPMSYEDYVHRIGRTGRANKKGIALTFVD
ncbi:DEAD/DEAH box helicase [Candidatus Parcubacteria bacterium]|nr:MAG: DEAD/DEAH box helicase [Candidatus Parcubacteria bacterium]